MSFNEKKKGGGGNGRSSLEFFDEITIKDA